MFRIDNQIAELIIECEVKMEAITNVMEYEEIARKKLPKMVYDYYASGAEDEWTLRENRNAFSRILWDFINFVLLILFILEALEFELYEYA